MIYWKYGKEKKTDQNSDRNKQYELGIWEGGRTCLADWSGDRIDDARCKK